MIYIYIYARKYIYLIARILILAMTMMIMEDTTIITYVHYRCGICQTKSPINYPVCTYRINETLYRCDGHLLHCIIGWDQPTETTPYWMNGLLLNSSAAHVIHQDFVIIYCVVAVLSVSIQLWKWCQSAIVNCGIRPCGYSTIFIKQSK